VTPRLPRLTGRRLVKLLEQHGFRVVRVRGSHHLLRHEDGRSTVVPIRRGETIGPGLLAKILRDARLHASDLFA
jgi:predicted RNA binding protein YcfA (HicA-like mRNA interferase family)